MTLTDKRIIKENMEKIYKLEYEFRIINDKNEGIQKYILLPKCSIDEKLIYEDKMYNNLVLFSQKLIEKNNIELEIKIIEDKYLETTVV